MQKFAADCQVLAQVVRLYFWLLFALQETKLSLHRFRLMSFGDQAKGPKGRRPETSSGSQGQGTSETGAAASPDDTPGSGHRCGAPSAPSTETLPDHEPPIEANAAAVEPRRGHGRLSAEAYTGAERAECRHEELALGDRCPVCGISWLYSLPPGTEVRINGQALLSAIRYDVEKRRCPACGERFSATLPEEAGDAKYHPSARTALALSRYFLSVPCGLPFHHTMANSRADNTLAASGPLGHQWKRPCDRRFIISQNPCPS